MRHSSLHARERDGDMNRTSTERVSLAEVPNTRAVEVLVRFSTGISAIVTEVPR
jgi:hypothetical protein